MKCCFFFTMVCQSRQISSSFKIKCLAWFVLHYVTQVQHIRFIYTSLVIHLGPIITGHRWEIELTYLTLGVYCEKTDVLYWKHIHLGPIITEHRWKIELTYLTLGVYCKKTDVFYWKHWLCYNRTTICIASGMYRHPRSGIILGMGLANERRRYPHTENDHSRLYWPWQ